MLAQMTAIKTEQNDMNAKFDTMLDNQHVQQ
jgi:hypothetical protein